MRGKAHEKLMEKLEAARRKAEEQRAAAEANRNRQAARTEQQAEYIRRTGRLPSFSYCSWCSWNLICATTRWPAYYLVKRVYNVLFFFYLYILLYVTSSCSHWSNFSWICAIKRVDELKMYTRLVDDEWYAARLDTPAVLTVNIWLSITLASRCGVGENVSPSGFLKALRIWESRVDMLKLVGACES